MTKDLISRQAAIDAINHEIRCGTVIDQCGLETAHDLIEDLQPEPQWVPVTEGLPEEGDAGILKKLGTEKKSELVLATVEVKGERMTVTACTYDGKWEWNMKYAFPNFKVVAWMPLPKPYAEKVTKQGETE